MNSIYALVLVDGGPSEIFEQIPLEDRKTWIGSHLIHRGIQRDIWDIIDFYAQQGFLVAFEGNDTDPVNYWYKAGEDQQEGSFHLGNRPRGEEPDEAKIEGVRKVRIIEYDSKSLFHVTVLSEILNKDASLGVAVAPE